MREIFHITHIRNLPGVIRSGGLWSDTERLKQKLNTTSIAHQHIKDRRARKMVDKAAFGFLSDYVPFYFAPRSPMLYAIKCGFVEGCEDGQEAVIHLVSTIDLAIETGNAWCYTDGHAEMRITRFFDELEKIDEVVDWRLMKNQFWFDTDTDPNRKWRRQAEFLVHRFFPFESIIEIGVIDRESAAKVEETVGNLEYKPAVKVRRGWYY